MSLVGNLEDLALGEILQIVSLSRKSGILALHSRGREGRIAFRSGLVTHATSSTCRQGLGEVLVQKGVIDFGILKQALALQERGDRRERVGEILVREFGVSSQAIEEVAREQIEKVVYSLFVWADGTFDFELQETLDVTDITLLDPMQFMLEQGLNPQYLAMEGSRIVDEQRHRGELDEEDSGASSDDNVDLAFDLLQAPASPPEQPSPVPEAPEPQPAPETPAAARPLAVIVDDDAETREALRAVLENEGYEPVDYEKGEDALIAVDGFYRAGRKQVAVVDLVMPCMDGSGILGGLELLELLHNNFSDIPVIVVSDFPNADAERKVRRMGYHFLLKPKKGELHDFSTLDTFSSALLPLLRGEVAVPEPASGVDLAGELRMELGEEIAPSKGTVTPSTGISILRGMLEELNNPSLGGGIILLVLRFASEFMNRAVVFLVKKDEIAGLGQFGVETSEGGGDSWVRNLSIPRGEESIFTRVLDEQQPMKAQPDGSRWNRYLVQKLGEGEPREVFLGPLVSEGKVVAVLYGDNLPEQKAIGDTDSLEIFLSQAGIAMEKAILQRRLKEKGQEGV